MNLTSTTDGARRIVTVNETRIDAAVALTFKNKMRLEWPWRNCRCNESYGVVAHDGTRRAHTDSRKGVSTNAHGFCFSIVLDT